MKCPKCQFENPAGKKFCGECGARLEVLCPRCQSLNPPQFKFCGDCGSKLEAPAETTRSISPTDSERKHVTVLFSDISGYTAMTEKLDPEEVKEIMGRVFGEISQVVARYEGFIEKFIGDAVMVLFGAQKAHEDDPVRAIRAAREIHDIVSFISPRYEKIIGRPLAMHTGICTGLVVTGEVNLEKGTHGVLGDTINTAARLSGQAKPGEIVVSPDTYHQAEGYFFFEPLEVTHVKGKAEQVKPYKVMSPREEPSKTHRISGLRAELIGRKVEMAQLQEALQNLRQGRGSIFSIVGDAGTGKSRLIEEFKATIDPAEVQWREGHAYAYSQNIPYFPVMDLLSRAWQIHEGDTTEQIRQKVEAGARARLGDREDLIPYVGSLYSLKYPEIENISPELWKARLHEALRLILGDLCKQAPAIICIEDLHWADSSSVEFLRLILKDFQLPAVFLCAYRPSFSLFTSHQLTGLSKVYNEIRLQDLSTSEAQTMVESLLKTEALPPDLRKFIQTKVEGNPFYLEEAINALIESGTLIRDNGSWKLTKQISEVVIPSTVQGIITARLDRLEGETKRILQEASVIGRAFLYEILKRITDLKDVVDRSLSGLERLDFIRTRTLQPDLEYIFKHALTQEVIYNGLLKKERQNIHERIGLVMEQLFHDKLPEFYETLAYHYRQGQSILKAVDFLTKAGEKSFRKYALDESHSYFKEAHDLLANKPDQTTGDEKLLIDLIIKWGDVHFFRADFIGFINLFKAHEALVESHADKEQLAMLYGWYGTALSRRDMPVDGYKYLKKALQIAEEVEDLKVIGYNCMWLTQVCADMGLLEEAVIFGERARKAANHFESDRYMFTWAFYISAYAYWFRGDVKKTAELGQVLLEYGKKHSDLRCIAYYYVVMGCRGTAAGDFPSAIECLKKCVEISPDPVLSHGARMVLGGCYLATGQLKEVQSTVGEAIEYSKKFGYEWIGAFAQAFKGMVLIAQGDLKQGVNLYEDANRVWLENNSLWRYAYGNYTMGRVYSQIAQGGGVKKDLSFYIKNIGFLIKTVPFAHKKAEDHLNIAIKTAGKMGAKSVLGQAYLELGKLHKAKGKTEKARECISNAIGAFEKCEADVFLKQAREALAALG
jgi:class 3 adenylate cyclase/tetratricopeptide (TPR) repeat protein